MRFISILALLFCITFAAHAKELRVQILQPAGQEAIEFKLEEGNVRKFWQRWSEMKPSPRMVPLSKGTGYNGLAIIDESTSDRRTIRLFHGVGMDGDRSKNDEDRALERWILGFAPPPMGAMLLQAVEQETIAAAPEKSDAILTKTTSDAVIFGCRKSAGHNITLKIRCLQDALRDSADPADYAAALENISKNLLPTAPNAAIHP